LPIAGAQAAMSCPRGPANVIGVVASGAHSATLPPRRPERRRAPPLAAARVFAAASPAAALSSAIAALPLTPSSPNLRTASRRVMIPSAWSSATSSARYRCSSVMSLSPPVGASWMANVYPAG
jgi:hypothetical protein